MSSRRVTYMGYGACALAGCLWGTGFYFGRLALNEMSVEYMVLYRFLFASLGMLPIALLNRVRLTRSEVRILLTATAFGIPVQFLLQFHGLALTTVSHASLMVGSMPVLLAVAAGIFAGERLDWLGWAALTGSTIGVALIVLGGSRGPATRGESSLAGDLLVVASLVTALAWILLNKKLMQTHSPTVVTSYSILLGTLMLGCITLGPWVVNPMLGRLRGYALRPPPLTGSATRHGLRLRSAACSAPRRRRCCGTGESIMCRPRVQVCSSISSRRLARCSACGCWASTLDLLHGWVVE